MAWRSSGKDNGELTKNLEGALRSPLARVQFLSWPPQCAASFVFVSLLVRASDCQLWNRFDQLAQVPHLSLAWPCAENKVIRTERVKRAFRVVDRADFIPVVPGGPSAAGTLAARRSPVAQAVLCLQRSTTGRSRSATCT